MGCNVTKSFRLKFSLDNSSKEVSKKACKLSSDMKMNWTFYFWMFVCKKGVTKNCVKVTAFLYPLKNSEKLWFSDVLRGYRKGHKWHEDLQLY